MTIFKCGKGSTHIDYLSGTQDMDILFSKSLDVNLRMFCCIRDAALGLITGLKKWIPIRWKLARRIDRDSIDCCENPWQNQYWTCC